MVENGLNIKEAAKTIAEIKASGSRKTVKGEGIVLLKNWSAGTTNSENPKSKFSGFVANGDEVSFQVWNNLPAYIFLEKEKHVAGETVVRIEYELSRYGMVINKMEPVDGYNPDDFIDYRYDIKVEGDEFSHALKESGATPKAISTISSLLCFKENNDINKRFCREFAALSHHDNCRTGLLAHTTKCLKIYNGIKGAYNFLLDERTNDLMVISLAIHDIGKIYEMHNGTYQEYSFVTHRGLAGFVKQLKEESGESRLIHICNGRVETIMVIPEWVSEVTNMIVTDDYVYLGNDKMLSIIDRKTKAIEYRTFLSGKAVKNLLKNRYRK